MAGRPLHGGYHGFGPAPRPLSARTRRLAEQANLRKAGKVAGRLKTGMDEIAAAARGATASGREALAALGSRSGVGTVRGPAVSAQNAQAGDGAGLSQAGEGLAVAGEAGGGATHCLATDCRAPAIRLPAIGTADGGLCADDDDLRLGPDFHALPYAVRLRVLQSVARLRDEQKPPEGDWRTWLLMGGRGSGKTRAGAEWVHGLATAGGQHSDLRIALVAETLGDAREVMIDGVSGICRIAHRNRPDFEASRRRLVWPNGAMAQIFSSEDPESLRGPQFHHAWCDELGKWKHGAETWDMLQFGLRLGERPRVLVTTTPRPVPVLKRLMAEAGTAVTRIATVDNALNLSSGFLAAMQARYGGTRLGRQELDGELIADREDGLWKRDMIEALTLRSIASAGPLSRIVVAVDPPAAASARGSCCGIVAAGLDQSGRAVVLADASVEGASPSGWANAALRTYRRFDADRIVAEINQGGDMVTAVLRSVDETVPVATVRATRGKWLRAEPVAALYEQGKVVHAGRFAELEDQMCDFGPDGLSNGRSPDRLDALVWALTALMFDRSGEPRVRGI